MSKRKKKSRKSRSGKNRTPIAGHAKRGKTLEPPFKKLGDKVHFTSWTNDRLPEMLWAALIRTAFEQDVALSEFRRVIRFIADHDFRERLSDITHTGIGGLDPSLKEEVIGCILANPETKPALSPLKLFEGLPARDDWLSELPEAAPDVDLLMESVASTLDHQSQEATDCRWLKVMAQMAAGKLQMPEETVKELVGYPEAGDQRAVRPSIRSIEGTFNTLAEPDLSWPYNFWEEGWNNTPCFVLQGGDEAPAADPGVARERLTEVESALEEHWAETHATTAVDARHDAVFGVAFYVLRLIDELLGLGVASGVLGRLGLRTILEAYISLHYLCRKDDPDLWKKWRLYGAGQAKLNALRFDTDMEPPKHIKVETIEQIAGEDFWEEYIDIDLGNWSKLDLRKLSERAELKDLYDAHFSWTSAYSHASWGAVRESSFRTCGNPLHRLHRYPRRNSLPDTVGDCVDLADRVLSDVDMLYPTFSPRLRG